MIYISNMCSELPIGLKSEGEKQLKAKMYKICPSVFGDAEVGYWP